ncbi:hypothetical protein ACTWQB_15080 [Piscibacillus sp. B03]|uniref:hypothetical protein n=1 Tax=Piscibacillus sp. B03 TaxID=3457430 RepID=UPI003FCE1171
MKKLLLIVLIVMIYVVTNGINVIERVLNQEETEQIEQENDESSSYTWTNDVLDSPQSEQMTAPPKEDDIIQKYESTFEELKENTINEIEEIKEEVLANLNEDPNPLQIGAIVLKYEQKATKLENEIDERFNGFFETYKQELNRYGYSTASVVKLERKYKRTKSQLKRDLVQEANAWIEERNF